MRSAPAVLTLLASWSSGCGATLQLIAGNDATTITSTVTHATIQVLSDPPGAEIVRIKDGTKTALGTAPVRDDVTYGVMTRSHTGGVFWGALLATLVEGGVGIGALGADALGPKDVRLLSLGLGGLLFAIVDSVLLEAAVDEGPERFQVGAGYTYVGTLEGKQDSEHLKLDQKRVALSFPVLKQKTTPLVMEKVQSRDPRWIVAVMNVEDGEKPPIARSMIDDLSEQLRIFVTGRGVRTIDRTAQEKLVQADILDMKRDSYRPCYDDHCQIALGKALAATHILRSRLTRFGARCVLNTELVDLISEVSIAAVPSEGTCSPEGLFALSKEAANALFAVR